MNFILYLVSVILVVFSVTAQKKYPFLKPCKVSDGKCQRNLWQNAVPYLVKGLPELNIAPLDPMKLENIKVEIPNILEVNFLNGVMEGFESCIFDNVQMNTHKAKANATIDLHCNITLEGDTKLTAQSLIIPNLNSNDLIKIEDKVKYRMENLGLTFYFKFKIIKDDQGDIKLKLRTPIGYKYKFGGPALMTTSKILLAQQDITDLALFSINTNWRFIMDNFSPPFFKKAMEIVGDIQKRFFIGVPAKEFISDPLEY